MSTVVGGQMLLPVYADNDSFTDDSESTGEIIYDPNIYYYNEDDSSTDMTGDSQDDIVYADGDNETYADAADPSALVTTEDDNSDGEALSNSDNDSSITDGAIQEDFSSDYRYDETIPLESDVSTGKHSTAASALDEGSPIIYNKKDDSLNAAQAEADLSGASEADPDAASDEINYSSELHLSDFPESDISESGILPVDFNFYLEEIENKLAISSEEVNLSNDGAYDIMIAVEEIAVSIDGGHSYTSSDKDGKSSTLTLYCRCSDGTTRAFDVPEGTTENVCKLRLPSDHGSITMWFEGEGFYNNIDDWHDGDLCVNLKITRAQL